MVLHSPLTVLERPEHSFDPFPDNGRVAPWGFGCSIAYDDDGLVRRNRAVVKEATQATTLPRSTTADGRSSTERSSSGLAS